MSERANAATTRPAHDRLLAHYIVHVGTPHEKVLDQAANRLIDSIGVAVGGLASAPARIARNLAAQTAPNVERGNGARVWGTRHISSVGDAAFANGVAVRYLDYNDAYFGRGGSHPSDTIAALVAIGEANRATGAELLEAIAVAYEVVVSLSDAFRVHDHGWDHVNVIAIGATCGIAHLLRFDENMARHALSLTVIPHAAMRQARRGQLTMWKAGAAPDAVRHSVYACQLARLGMHGPEGAFDGDMGFHRQILNDTPIETSALASLAALARPTRLLDTHLKRWPVGYVAQGTVDAATKVHARRGPLQPNDLVTIRTFDYALNVMVSPEKLRPMTRETADHSLPYAVMCALLRGEVTLADFEPERFAAPETHAYLAESITVEPCAEFTDAYPAAHPSEVIVRASTGERFSETVWHPAGHASNPFDEIQIREKFRSLVDDVLPEPTTLRLLTLLTRAGCLETVEPLLDLLVIDDLDRREGDL